MNSNISDLPMAVIRATRPDATGVRAAQIIGGLGVGKYLRDLRRFHLRASTLLRSCCSPAMRGNSHRASHGSGESCAGGGICPLRPGNSRRTIGGFHNSRTGSEFRFLITRSTTTFLVAVGTVFAPARGIPEGDQGFVCGGYSGQTSALLCGRRMARQTNSVGWQVDAQGTRRARECVATATVETRLDLLPVHLVPSYPRPPKSIVRKEFR